MVIDGYQSSSADPACRKTAGGPDTDLLPSTAAVVAAELLLLRECLARSRDLLDEPAAVRH